MPPIKGVLFDMNGLFRIWNNTGAAHSEALAELPPGTIARYAYDHPAYRTARVGIMTDTEWAQDVASRLAADFHRPLNDIREALVPWRQDRGTPVSTMIALLNEVRRHVPTGVLSNCTDALATDLQHHGITFDHICSSAELGVDKPSPMLFASQQTAWDSRPRRSRTSTTSPPSSPPPSVPDCTPTYTAPRNGRNIHCGAWGSACR